MLSGAWSAITGKKDKHIDNSVALSENPRTGRDEETDWESLSGTYHSDIDMDVGSSRAPSEASRHSRKRRHASDPDLNSRLRAYHQAANDSSRENEGLKDELARWKSEACRYRDDREIARREADDYKRQLHDAQRERDFWRMKADKAEREVAAKDALLTLRTDELTHAQTFLSTTERVSHADVLRMVENLNDLSSQLASELTECLTFSRSSPRTSSSSRPVVEKALGEGFTNSLIRAEHTDLPTMVSVAFSAAISRAVMRLATSWGNPESDPANFVQRTYKHILEKEPQAISARWRILAYRSIQEASRDVDVVSIETQHLLELLEHIVRVSRASHSKQYSAEQTKKMVLDVVTHCLEIKRVITEEITSTNFEVFHPSPGAPFDFGSMEDVDSDGNSKSQSNSPILVTSDVGLMRRDRAEGLDGVVTSHIVLKAKVFLSLSR